MRYNEYTLEQLEKLSTKRLLNLFKSARQQYPSVVGTSVYNECFCGCDCSCAETSKKLVEAHEQALARIKLVLDTKEHVVRKKG